MRFPWKYSFVLVMCIGSQAWGQATTPDPTPELQRQDRQRQEIRQRIEVQPWSPSNQVSQTPPHQKLPDEQPCVQVSHVLVQGVLSSDALKSALSGIHGDDSPYGRCLGSKAIELLIQRVQQVLVEQGYITSHVYVPEQNLNSGTLLIQINEGRLASIRSESEVNLPNLAWALDKGQILNLRDIEQSSDNLRRLTSLKNNIQLEPGIAAGSTDLVVNLEAGRPLHLGLSVDDGGSRTTGKLQGNATLSWDNPLGLADLLYVTQGKDLGDKANGPRGSSHTIVHYSLPWGYWLLGATVSRNRSEQTVYGPYESYLYSGTSGQNELSLARVLHRDGRSKTTASLKGFLRQSNNYIADLEVLVQQRRTAGWEAALQHLHYLQTGTMTLQLAYRRGTGAFGAKPAPEELTSQGTGRMGLITSYLHWAMPFNASGHPWQFSSQLQWQWTQTRLTPQDKFCIGGRSTVRGFSGQQTLCGDTGQLWRHELSTNLPETLAGLNGLQMFAGADTGRTTTPGQGGSQYLAGMTFGLRGQHKLSEKNGLQWEVFIGKPLRRPDGFTAPQHIAGFTLRTDF